MTMRHAFSLVELSIVLVILGLLIGGILSGQALIRAAELRSVSTEYQKYVTATQTFRDKYFALPGDMANAGKFWGYANTAGAGGVCADSAANTGTGTLTCDGNGNGTVGSTITGSENFERFRFWQHLANAGLIEGTYTGITNSGGTLKAVIGENVPPSKLSNAGWSFQHSNNSTGAITTDYPFSGHYFWFGGNVASDNSTGTRVLKPEEAWGVDVKVDDGRPGTGAVKTWRAGSGVPNCSNSNGALTGAADAAQATYNVQLNSIECALQLMVN
jgi:prepilin-type N-terminal cleavage/methylation domain-containing protein